MGRWGPAPLGGPAPSGGVPASPSPLAPKHRPAPSARTASPDGGGAPDRLHSLTLRLPREPSSVPVARHIARQLLEALGTDRRVIDDVETGVGEACANTVQHAWRGDAYDLAITVDGPVCSVRVIDEGPGFDPHGVPPASPSSEGGRGLALMWAVADQLQIVSHPEQGTVVRLTRLMDRGPRDARSEARRPPG